LKVLWSIFENIGFKMGPFYSREALPRSLRAYTISKIGGNLFIGALLRCLFLALMWIDSNEFEKIRTSSIQYSEWPNMIHIL
jgi:hypothetical protein